MTKLIMPIGSFRMLRACLEQPGWADTRKKLYTASKVLNDQYFRDATELPAAEEGESNANYQERVRTFVDTELTVDGWITDCIPTFAHAVDAAISHKRISPDKYTLHLLQALGMQGD